MFRLVDALNTYNPSLVTLKEMGYDIGLLRGDDSDDDDGLGQWWAKKEDREFYAFNPLSLLGLVAIWECRGELWKRNDDPDLYEDIIDQVYGDA